MPYSNALFLLFLAIFIGCGNNQIVPLDLNRTPVGLELFAPDIVSTDLYERDMAITTNGDEIIYTLGNQKQTIRSLVQIKKTKNGWGEGQIVFFPGKYQDIEPFISIDGNQLYFASDRPISKDSTRTDYNIWVSEKQNQIWQEPKPLDTVINSKRDEFYPSITAKGNLYFTSSKENGVGREDIFVSHIKDGAYQIPVALDTTINTVAYEFNAFVSPEEDLLIFSSYGRTDDLGGGDLYFSKKNNQGNWQEAKNMGPFINSNSLDYCPFIDFPRGVFYFTSERQPTTERSIKSVSELRHVANQIQNGSGNIYCIDIEKLNFK